MKWKVGAGIALLMLLLWGPSGPHFTVNLDKRTYSAGEELELTTWNVSLTPIYFGQGTSSTGGRTGTGCRLELACFSLLFIAILYDLPPFHSWKQEIILKYLPENGSPGESHSHPDLPPGRYR